MAADEPLVSCIMPTKDRRAFIPAAVDCWLKQTYENRELLIVDDGLDKIGDLLKDSAVRYIDLPFPSKIPLGKKRNFSNGLAHGELICHWDDDDWSAPDRIERQVATLEISGLPITGFGPLLFWDIAKYHARCYRPSTPHYVCGTTLCYLKSYWQSHPFKENKQVGEDNEFVYPALNQIAASDDLGLIVARIHGQQTSNKKNISNIVSCEMIPSAFWENEELRLKHAV